MPPAAAQPRDVVIRAGAAPSLDFAELWRFRELFWTLASRTVLARYKQSMAGVLWALVRPVVTALVLTVLFKRIAGMQSTDVPYPLLVLAGVVPWTLFAMGLTNAANSTIANTKLITKTYFPRIIIPTAAVVVALIDFAFGMVVLAALLAWYGIVPSPLAVLWLPLFISLAVATAAGLGYWFSAINVVYRDVREAVGYLVNFGLLLSPVGFRSLVIPEQYHAFYALNPMVTVINGFRWTLLGAAPPRPLDAAASVTMALTLLVSGYLYFRHREPHFADVI